MVKLSNKMISALKRCLQHPAKLARSKEEAEEESHVDKAAKLSESMHRVTLNPSHVKKLIRFVTWADEEIDSNRSINLCEV